MSNKNTNINEILKKRMEDTKKSSKFGKKNGGERPCLGTWVVIKNRRNKKSKNL